MKKLLSVLLIAVMLFAMAACGTNGGSDELKVGFIFLHDEQSTYDKNFIDAAKEACEKMGVKMVQKTQIPESQACYDAGEFADSPAAIKILKDLGAVEA